jgi:hypothetical protein
MLPPRALVLAGAGLTSLPFLPGTFVFTVWEVPAKTTYHFFASSLFSYVPLPLFTTGTCKDGLANAFVS